MLSSAFQCLFQIDPKVAFPRRAQPKVGTAALGRGESWRGGSVPCVGLPVRVAGSLPGVCSGLVLGMV